MKRVSEGTEVIKVHVNGPQGRLVLVFSIFFFEWDLQALQIDISNARVAGEREIGAQKSAQLVLHQQISNLNEALTRCLSPPPQADQVSFFFVGEFGLQLFFPFFFTHFVFFSPRSPSTCDMFFFSNFLFDIA